MPSFELPCPYEGWSEERLKEHCRSLSRAYNKYQQIILVLAEHGYDTLPKCWKDEVDGLKRAYSDD
jgi:hypothetical protein